MFNVFNCFLYLTLCWQGLKMVKYLGGDGIMQDNGISNLLNLAKSIFLGQIRLDTF